MTSTPHQQHPLSTIDIRVHPCTHQECDAKTIACEFGYDAPIVLFFSADWCTPCQDAKKTIMQHNETHQSALSGGAAIHRLVTVPVNCHRRASYINTMIGYACRAQDDELLMELCQIVALPTFVLIKPEGLSHISIETALAIKVTEPLS